MQDGEIGVITNGRFESHTNFSFEIVHAVASPVEACIIIVAQLCISHYYLGRVPKVLCVSILDVCMHA